MKLSIIPEDGSVFHDGEGRGGLSYTTPADVRALQWDGSNGEVEYHSKPNEFITSLPQWAVDAVGVLDVALFVPTPTQEELDAQAYAQAYAQAKQDKVLAVSQITVTTTSGNVFDGDEVAQSRMSRAVTASDTGDITQWILADNTQATVTREELKEALLLAGRAMTVIWVA